MFKSDFPSDSICKHFLKSRLVLETLLSQSLNILVTQDELIIWYVTE